MGAVGEVRHEAPGATSDGGVCERHLKGASVGMQWGVDPGGCIWGGRRKQFKKGTSEGWEETFVLERIWKNTGTWRRPRWRNDLEKHLGRL